MATKAQINANRQNAEKSTGPKTAEGKEAVSQNAFKHGLFVDKAVVRDESQDDYDRHRQALLAQWEPVGEMESIVAARLVNLTWRLERAQRMQNQSIDVLGLEELDRLRADQFRGIYREVNGISMQDAGISKDHLLLGRMATRDWSSYRVLDKMMLYERRIENSMYETMHELEKLQEARKAEHQSAEEKPPAARHRSNLKKQSQFSAELMGTKS